MLRRDTRTYKVTRRVSGSVSSTITIIGGWYEVSPNGDLTIGFYRHTTPLVKKVFAAGTWTDMEAS